MENFKEALEKKIKEIAEKFGKCDIYYVGGYVRDELLDKFYPDNHTSQFKDVDLVINMENGAEEFVKFLKASYPEDCTDFAEYPRFGTAKFTLHFDMMTSTKGKPWRREEPIECVSPRSEKYDDGPRKPSSVQAASIKEDAMRRDFCCNALYKNVITGKILDPTGMGIEDVKNKVLRTPLDPALTYKDDPLRMLRAIRFAAKKEFSIEENTFKSISPIPEYYQLSMERVRDEFSQIVCSLDAPKYIWMLHDTGLLKYIIPELEDAWGFNQNSKYHSMNLTDHCFSVLEKVIKTSFNRFASGGKLQLCLAALLHDISKYKIHETNLDGTFSYHSHEEYSADMAKDILTRLKYPNDVIDETCLIIRSHMKLKSQYNYSTNSYTGTKKSMGKFLRSLSDSQGLLNDKILDSVMKLIDADNLSHSPEWNMPGQVESFWNKWDQWFSGYAKNTTRNIFNNPVSGKDIMDRFGLKPGKTIGYIKDEIIFGFAIEHRDYDKETLLDMYEAEFGEGRKLYVWRGLYGACASIEEPKVISSNSGHFQYTLDNHDSIYKLDRDEYCLLGDKDLVELSALENPELFMRIRIHKRSREILSKVWDDLGELQDMPGFEKVSLSLDCDNDVSAKVEWKNHRPDYII